MPEILINNPAISNLIREDKVHQIYSQMQLGQGESGMQTQTQVMVKLVQGHIIDKSEALRFSTRPDELIKAIQYIS